MHFDDGAPHDARPYRLEPVSMGGVAGRYNFDKALELADQLEDEEIARQFQQLEVTADTSG